MSELPYEDLPRRLQLDRIMQSMELIREDCPVDAAASPLTPLDVAVRFGSMLAMIDATARGVQELARMMQEDDQ